MIRSAKGTQQLISDGSSPADYNLIGQVRSITGPTTSATTQDVTTHSTAGNWMEKLAVLIDPGTLSFPMNYDADDDTHAFASGLWSFLIALTEADHETIFPASLGTLTYSGYISGHPFDLPTDNVIQTTIEITINGAIQATNP